MRCTMICEVEHLGGPARIEIATDLEPNSDAWSRAAFETMADALNRALAAMLSERDRIRFEEDRAALGERAGARADH